VIGDIYILMSMALFGSYALFLRLSPEIPTLTFLFAFQVVGAIGFFFLGRSTGFPKLSRRSALLLLALAVCAVAQDLLYFASLRATTVANAALAHQSVSIFLLFLAPLLLRERTRRAELVALVVSLVGIAILYGRGANLDGANHLLGITYSVTSGLLLALVFILYRVLLDEARGFTPSVVNFWRCGISTLLLLPFTPLMDLPSVQPRHLLVLLGFGLLFAVIGSGLHTAGVRRTRSLHVSILGRSEPVFASIYALIVLKEVPSLEAVVGGVIIIGASVWLAFQKERTVPGEPSQEAARELS
jgi:drug/metabolite transporter, DME family